MNSTAIGLLISKPHCAQWGLDFSLNHVKDKVKALWKGGWAAIEGWETYTLGGGGVCVCVINLQDPKPSHCPDTHTQNPPHLCLALTKPFMVAGGKTYANLIEINGEHHSHSTSRQCFLSPGRSITEISFPIALLKLQKLNLELC